ncbi:hypothetical protein L6164_036167 [Bauhinia variegata]|uniref:Uncharacterized protein n=1 Tax=Bauhinia variegata TaxID=167791 RepID=A0ACB9KG68_BAUVA|nr:hypothetical protein L6164_036167 [Bauhinia variegata]
MMAQKRGTMSCSTVLVNNFSKAEDFNLDGGFNITAKMKSNQKAIIRESSSNSGLRSSIDMSQTICLFKKYLTKAQNNIGRTSMEESQVIKRCHYDEDAAAVPVSESDQMLPRKASLLEQKFLPQCNGAPSSASEDKSATGQLTIFYGGAINVYDKVPADKAQAIMLLAGEISLSNSAAANEIPEADIRTSHQSNLTPTSKIKTGPSMARRVSLQCFLKKRHDRMFNKSPYASLIPKDKTEQTKKEEYSYQHQGVSLAPFPSHGGFNFPGRCM